MTKHYENLNFMAHLRTDGAVTRRLLKKFASMGMFYQRIRRYSSRYIIVPVLRIGDNRLSDQTRTLYSVFDLSSDAVILLAVVNEILLRKELLTLEEVTIICAKHYKRMIVQKLRSVRFPSGWRIVRFAILCENQCVIIEAGDLGYEIIGYYIKAASFKNIDCIPKNNLPKYRTFDNFL